MASDAQSPKVTGHHFITLPWRVSEGLLHAPERDGGPLLAAHDLLSAIARPSPECPPFPALYFIIAFGNKGEGEPVPPLYAYIGQSRDVQARLHTHLRGNGIGHGLRNLEVGRYLTATILAYPCSLDLERAEKDAISKFRPILNRSKGGEAGRVDHAHYSYFRPSCSGTEDGE